MNEALGMHSGVTKGHGDRWAVKVKVKGDEALTKTTHPAVVQRLGYAHGSKRTADNA